MLIIHQINQVSIGINIGYTINLYQDWLLLIILVLILVIVVYYHPVQALVQIYIIAHITGCKKDTKTVSCLFCYLFLIYQWQHQQNKDPPTSSLQNKYNKVITTD